MDRIITTRGVLGFAQMQLCAVEDVSIGELITFANKDNPSGTDQGWVQVELDNKQAPIQCEKYPERKHYILTC